MHKKYAFKAYGRGLIIPDRKKSETYEDILRGSQFKLYRIGKVKIL